MNKQKNIEFANALLEETDIFYQWSNGRMRIGDKVLELIIDKAENRCGRDSLWESGSHRPGKDQEVNGESVSSKSSKLVRNKFGISSYRLTTCETVEDFINEIKKRDESFSKYLVCLTEEFKNKHVVRWGFVDKLKTDISGLEWKYKYGKSGRKSALVTLNGKYQIKFSMSNQLWINLTFDDFETICTYEYNLKK